MSTASALFDGVRQHGVALLGSTPEPSAELLALVWGPRFDREHARSLLERSPGLQPDTVRSVMRAADLFDGLPLPRQQRIRQLIARHGLAGGGATMPA